jgi:hypothetical protein
MITSRQIIEAYHTGVRVGKNYVEVFKNPSKSELAKEFGGKEIRFLADPKRKDIYVWDAYIATHDDLQDELLPKDLSIDEVISGQASKEGSVYVAYSAANIAFILDDPDGFDLEDFETLKSTVEKDWSWTERHQISLTKLVKGLKEDLEDAIAEKRG